MRLTSFNHIRPTKLKFYLRFMRERGFKDQDVLHGTGLSRELLEDLSIQISIPVYIQIVSNMMRLINDPALAFWLGNSLRPVDFGILGHALSASENIRQASELWNEYSELFFGNLIQNNVRITGQKLHLEAEPLINLKPHLELFFMEEKINVEAALFSRFNDHYASYERFWFSYPEPDHGHLYKEICGTKVRFEQARNVCTALLDSSHYELPFPNADKETLHVCENYLSSCKQEIYHHPTLESRIIYEVTTRLPQQISLDEMAQILNLSGRTFSRALQKRGTDYPKLIASARKDLANNYLATTSLSTDRIAELLGYSDTSSFRRAYKQWTGSTVREAKLSFKQLD